MKRFRDILFVVEPGENSGNALKRTITLAENNQGSVTVMAVADAVTAGIGMPPGGPISAKLQQTLVDAHARGLEALVDPYRARIKIETKVLVGVSFLEIIREVLRGGRDLVVKTPENPEWLSRLFGSDDMHLMRKCPCPVWMIKPQAKKSYRRILAAVDSGDDYPPAELATRQALNLQILEIASSLALSEFAELHIVHAWMAIGESLMRGGFARMPDDEIVAYVEEIRSQQVASFGDLIDKALGKLGRDSVDFINPQTHLVKGAAVKEIPALARELEADLVVMGTVGRTGIPGFFMGNTAESILSHLDCSVLAIKPPGFVTPVTLTN